MVPAKNLRAALLTSLWLASSAVVACSYDGRPQDLKAAHPQSMSVALAIHQSYQDGIVSRPAPLMGGFGMRRAQHHLSRLAEAIPATNDVPAFTLLLVEPGLWSRYGEQLEMHISPDSGEVAVITGEGPLLAMSKGALDFDQALERGLLRVEGEEQDRARVIQGLRAAAALMANPEKSDSVALR
ncbi:hypothetical protein ACRSLK_12010 [Halopseudomonas pachastrellae]|uniref:hypothetical protein n=1 Tax=Halopseudomonas pachastrellae TaxID=254161 RepID=UPI003D7E3655